MKNLPYGILYSLYNANREEVREKYQDSVIFFEMVNGYSSSAERVREVERELSPEVQDRRISRNKMPGLKGIIARMLVKKYPETRAEGLSVLPPMIRTQIQ